ncbi:MAG: hypothetical protein R3Y56_06020 [Akkermansia sp.]
MSSNYIPAGDPQRLVNTLDHFPDITVSVEEDNPYHRNYDEGEGLVDHVPFFATQAEAAGVQHWLAVARLDLPSEDVYASRYYYLLAGWVNGMLALKLSLVQPDTQEDKGAEQAGGYNYSLVHYSQVDDILPKVGDKFNVTGLSCWCIATWSPCTWGHHPGVVLYMGIHSGVVFFWQVGVGYAIAPTIGEGTFEADSVYAYPRLPSLAGYAQHRQWSQATAPTDLESARVGEYGPEPTDEDLKNWKPLTDYAGIEESDDLITSLSYTYSYPNSKHGWMVSLALRIIRCDHCEVISSASARVCIREDDPDGDSGETPDPTNPDDPTPSDPTPPGVFIPIDPEEEPDGGKIGKVKYAYLAGAGMQIAGDPELVRNGEGEFAYKWTLKVDSSYINSLLSNLTADGSVTYNANHTFPGANIDVEMGIASATAQGGASLTGNLTMEFAGSDGDNVSKKSQPCDFVISVSPSVSDNQQWSLYSATKYEGSKFIKVKKTTQPSGTDFLAKYWYEISLDDDAITEAAEAQLKQDLQAKTVNATDTMDSHGESLTATASGTALNITIDVS